MLSFLKGTILESIPGTINTYGVYNHMFLDSSNHLVQLLCICACFIIVLSIRVGKAIVWPNIIEKGLHIHFAYQSFKWQNNAKKNAAVHVVIIGLSADPESKKLFEQINKNWHPKLVSNISPYLIESKNTIAHPRRKPLSDINPFTNGSIAADGRNLILTNQQKDELISTEPKSKAWIKPYQGADDVLTGKSRYCLWLLDCSKEELLSMPEVAKRVERVREARLASPKQQTKRKAETPHLFTEIRQPEAGNYLAIPRTSSENRRYIPIAYIDHSIIANNDLQIVPNASLYEFGVLTSEMHNDWMRTLGGRLESRYRYSSTMVYNTFPWPSASTEKRNHVQKLAENILLIREDYPEKSLSELYDPKYMPEPLRAAHKTLDRAVEELYRDKPFRDASERLEYLFARYEKVIDEEDAKSPAKKKTKGSN
jgi:hypothetical protein